jgi:transposase InsO family protein
MKLPVPISMLCEKVCMSRQNYYKGKRMRKTRTINDELIVSLVRQERALQPRLGGRKLYYLLKPKLEEEGVLIGRDRFFALLSRNGLLLEPLPKAPRTTNSRHTLPIFRNLLATEQLDRSNQGWVSDITYIRTDEGFIYLSLIMDAWSRKIVGYHAADTLETEGCLKALEKALIELPVGSYPIHHSDRGSQYCSHLYTQKLMEHGLKISMTEVLHCYENAQAERVNGILKQEYGLGKSFRNKSQALVSVDQAIKLYNTRRPHLSLNYRTPEEVHSGRKRVA